MLSYKRKYKYKCFSDKLSFRLRFKLTFAAPCLRIINCWEEVNVGKTECWDFGVEYSGPYMNPPQRIQGGPIACRDKCRSTNGCKYFVFRRKYNDEKWLEDMYFEYCQLKAENGYLTIPNYSGAVSGTVEAVCGDEIIR